MKMKEVIVALALTYIFYFFGFSGRVEAASWDREIGAWGHSALIPTLILLLAAAMLASINIAKKFFQSKNQLNVYNKLLSSFIDADSRLIYLKDQQLRYVFVNKALQDFFKKGREEILGRDDFDLIDEDFASIQRTTDLEVLEKKERVMDNVKWRDRYLAVNKFPVLLMTGDYGVGAYIEDITEASNAHNALKESKEKLQLILDSTAEGIYGMDIHGNCNFCNASCVKMLGYKNPEELIGKNMHHLIHHSKKDGSEIPLDQCEIFKAFIEGKRSHVTDEVFWRVDGTCFDVEYHSYPQYKDGKIVGAVVTFIDITERREAEEKIRYLSLHDALTGLYHRGYFEEELKRLDRSENLPIAVIVGDVNNLKLANDIFGHSVGDQLLRKTAQVFKKACRAGDIVARIGGDEFVILLPKTDKDQARKIILRIQRLYGEVQIGAVRGSISMGCDAKTYPGQDISKILQNAEDDMYSQKVLDFKIAREHAMGSIVADFFNLYPQEKSHSKRVREISEKIGRALGLSPMEMRKLREAAYLHDIGKVAFYERLAERDAPFNHLESAELRQHPVVGFRFLNYFNKTLDLAETVLAHHEHWDGSGYPKGLKGEEIPKLARIIAIANSFDAWKRGDLGGKPLTDKEALEEVKQRAGSQFDPELVKVMEEVI